MAARPGTVPSPGARARTATARPSTASPRRSLTSRGTGRARSASPRGKRKKAPVLTAETVEVGQRVLVFKYFTGTVRYVGKVHFMEGLAVGIELDSKLGTHTGTIGGTKYFQAEPGHGFFALGVSHLSFAPPAAAPSFSLMASLNHAMGRDVTAGGVGRVEDVYDKLWNGRISDETALAAGLNKSGGDADTKDFAGYSPIHILAATGRAALLQQVLKAGRHDVNQPNHLFQTPLHIAAVAGQADVIAVMLQNGGDCNKIDAQGWTPAMAALAEGEIPVMQTLLRAPGAMTDPQDRNGDTMLHVAARTGNLDAVKALVELGPKLDARNNAGWTAVMIAAANGHQRVVGELMAAGARGDLVDGRGRNAASYAREHGFPPVAELLERRATKTEWALATLTMSGDPAVIDGKVGDLAATLATAASIVPSRVSIISAYVTAAATRTPTSNTPARLEVTVSVSGGETVQGPALGDALTSLRETIVTDTIRQRMTLLGMTDVTLSADQPLEDVDATLLTSSMTLKARDCPVASRVDQTYILQDVRGTSQHINELSPFGQYLDVYLSDEPGVHGRLTIHKDAMLGSGVQGAVHVGVLSRPNAASTLVAVKLPVPRFAKAVLEEGWLLAALYSDYLVHCLGWCYPPPAPCIVLEFMPDGDLHMLLYSRIDVPLSLRARVTIIAHIARGVAYMHGQGFCHRDIKPANVLVSLRNGELACKLSDAGTSTRDFLAPVAGIVGTLRYIAPEAYLGNQNTQQSDVYSLGVVAWEVLSRLVPFAPMRTNFAASNLPGAMQPVWGDPTIAMVTAMLQENPASRPSASSVATFFSDLAGLPSPTKKRKGGAASPKRSKKGSPAKKRAASPKSATPKKAKGSSKGKGAEGSPTTPASPAARKTKTGTPQHNPAQKSASKERPAPPSAAASAPPPSKAEAPPAEEKRRPPSINRMDSKKGVAFLDEADEELVGKK